MSGKLKTIPLCQLKPSKINVRKTDRLADIEQLAASIDANGLLENLIVQRVANGAEPSFEVVAGGRRLAALKLLAKRKKVDREHPVACLVVDKDAPVTELSLVENFARLPLHPADQFEAFAALVGEGLSTDDIAARFGVTPTFVLQRLKLAAVSPRLIDAYRKGAMTLEQLTAFTLTGDHTAQEAVWFDSPYAELPAAAIRRALTKSQIEATDRRAVFVGVQAYEAAGGTIVRDLFDSENEGYFADSQLLDRLVAEKLEQAAVGILAEGWQWVEIHPDADLADLAHFGRAKTRTVKLSKREEKRLSKLAERYDELVAELEDGDESKAQELDRVSGEMTTLHNKKETWPDTVKARSGTILSLDWNGTLQVTRGLLKRDPRTATAAQDGESRQQKGREARSGYADSIVLDLSAHRTAALRAVVAGEPQLGLLALLHALVEQLLYDGPSRSCLNIAVNEVILDRASSSVGTSKAVTEFLARHAAWKERLPEPEGLWNWLVELAQDDRLGLLAPCTALTVDALVSPVHRSGQRDATALLRTAKLDMRAWWRPTAANFFGRLSKSEIVAAVSEAVSAKERHRLDGLKKDPLAAEAEKLVSPTAWLPPTLRLPEIVAESP